MSEQEFCLNHPDRKAVNICHGCQKPFCAECLVEGAEYYYCKAEACQSACAKERVDLKVAEASDKLPLTPDEKAWVDKSFHWLIEQFGADTLRSVPIVVPTPEFFPDRYDRSEDAVESLVHTVCGYMRVDPARLDLVLYQGRDPMAEMVPVYQGSQEGAAGLFRQAEGSDKLILGLDMSLVDKPEVLVAAAAHELAHVHLLADKRLTGKEDDQEPLTDLLTVFFGLGIFTANAAFQFSQWQAELRQGWQASRMGYLSEPLYGYALAAFSWLRGDRKAKWSKYLAGDVDYYRKRCAKYLSETDGVGLPTLTGP